MNSSSASCLDSSLLELAAQATWVRFPTETRLFLSALVEDGENSSQVSPQ
jgi:hypothetical protein